MKPQDINQIRQLFNDGFQQVVLPHLKMYADLYDHVHRLARIERKLDNTIVHVDEHSVRLTRFEKEKS